MGYEERMEAGAEMMAERAGELVREGKCDDEIGDRILAGEFDDVVKQRMEILKKKKGGT